MKNILIGILSIVSVGSLYYAYNQTSRLNELTSCAAEREELKKQTAQHKLEIAELQKMYDQATVEMQVQRTICEEQLKAIKNK